MGVNAIEIPHKKDITCLTFKPDSAYIVGADSSGAVRQWRIEDGADVTLSAMKMSKTVHSAVASADGRWIVCGAAERKVVVWSAVTHQKAFEVTEHTGHVYAIDVSSDSKRFASGSHDLTVRIFDIITGTRLLPPLQHAAHVVGVRFSPNGTRIATSTLSHSFVGVYDAHSGNKLFEVPVTATCTPTTPLAWSPDGRKLFAASLGKITSIDTSTSSRSEWPIHDNSSPQVSIATSGKLVACSAGSSVSLWDSTSHEPITRIKRTNPVTCLAISHDGKFLACGRATGIVLYNLEECLPGRYLHSPVVTRLPLLQISETVLKSWMPGNSREAEAILSDEVAQESNPTHYVYATRALMRAHLGEWKPAMEDAEMSLQIMRSPIGQIAKSIAHVGLGEQEMALDALDFVFCDCDPGDIILLLVINSILMYMCNKRQQAISRLRSLIHTTGEKMKDYYLQVLGNMYLKQGDYKDATETLGLVKNHFSPKENSPLTTISIIFNWDFEDLEFISWQCLCESLYTSGSLKEVGDVLQKISGQLCEGEKERVYAQILEEIITRSGEVALLAWTGKASSCNSCLPSSPAVYSRTQSVLSSLKLEGEALQKRTAELRENFSLTDALVAYGWVTRSQRVRFAHFRLHLPCVVFHVKGLEQQQGDEYRAETVGLGDVEFATADALPLKEPHRLVFVNPWIDHLREARNQVVSEKDSFESVVRLSSEAGSYRSADSDGELVHASLMEEVLLAPPSSDTSASAYTRALELIAHLGQPFTALLLLRQPDGAYKRVAADQKITACGMGNNVPKDLRVEVLEVI